jgi:hypothetical protein
MGKLSTLSPVAPAAPKAAIRTRSTSPDTRTYEGGDGFTRKTKSELFLLAVSNMVGEDTFYESSTDRDKRYRDLIAKVTAKDPDWIRRFVPFLRNEMNMRSASIVMAVEYVIAGGANGRGVIDSAIMRADEPAEVIGYYRSRAGRSIPQPIKRGVADAIRRLYTEKTALKYDSDKAGYRPADVIDIVHPEPRGKWQSDLFRYLLEKRHGRDNIVIPEGLEVLRAHAALMALPVAERRSRLSDPAALEAAGMTWEGLSGWLQGPMDAEAWSAIIPSMGYMALLRNLRNFEQAGVTGEARSRVIDHLTNAEAVQKSKQFPIRFYSAFKNIESLDFKSALETAIEYTLLNVPVLSGRNLIMVDNSSSMDTGFSEKGSITFREAAGLFGAALAKRSESADLIPYASESWEVGFTRATPVLSLAKQASAYTGGTQTFDVLARRYAGHDRVIILTDEQAFQAGGVYRQYYIQGGNAKSVDHITCPIYTFNLAGYKQGMLASGKDNRYTFGGLTDVGFRMISLIEQAKDADWPF